jgi:hypothetical protein
MFTQLIKTALTLMECFLKLHNGALEKDISAMPGLLFIQAF